MDVLILEVAVVLHHLLGAHTAAEEFQDQHDRIAQAPDTRFVVADIRVDDDTRQEGGLELRGGRCGLSKFWTDLV